MPELTVTKQSSLPIDQAFQRACDALSNNPSLKKLDPSYECKFDPASFSGTASGKIFSAKINVQDSSKGSLIKIILNYPLRLVFMKGLLKSKLEQKMGEFL